RGRSRERALACTSFTGKRARGDARRVRTACFKRADETDARVDVVRRENAMRVLLFHPWGRFDPAFCGASYTACAQLEELQKCRCEVHCVLQEIPGWGLTASSPDAITARFACVKSVRALRSDCPPVAPQNYGDEFRQLLYAGERAARSS